MTDSQEQLRALYAQAINALNQGNWPLAARLAGQLLPLAPDHAGVQFVAGVAGLGCNDLQAAVAHLRTATRLNPQRADYVAQLARAYAACGALSEATEAATRALGLADGDALTCDTLGVVFTRCNEHALAARAFERAVERMPQRAGYRYNLATSLMFAGEMARAEQEYAACIALEPTQWRAHLALSQLRRQTREDNHLPALQALLERHGAQPEAGLYLNLALAKELEDMGAYADSLAHLTAGKQRIALARRYDVRRDAALFAQLADVFDGGDSGSHGHGSAEPIFIVGMPRSGTTLVDRILSSHPQVHSAGELMNFPVTVRRLSGGGRELLDGGVVSRAKGLDWARLGEQYIRSTRPGTGSKPRFTDKLPHNFQYIGHILHALPKAKIVLVRRDAMDVCLGNFRQLFAMDSAFYDYSFDLLDVGRYYIQFERLMAHWLRAYPGRIHQLRYEALVEDQVRVTRGLLDYCGLPWDEACLRFHENQAPTATASVVQVREPLHARFRERWRHYGEAMEPLRALLEDAGVEVPAALAE